MKKTLIILILSAILQSVSGQTFPLKSSIWYHANNGGSSAPNSTLTKIEYDKDTLISGVQGRMLTNGLVFYSKNDSVFYYNTKQNKFGLLYDFTAKVGDTVTISMPPNITTSLTSFEIVIDSITIEKYSNDTVLKFLSTPVNPDYHFEDNIYRTRIGAFNFLPTFGVSIPEGDYLKCYQDSKISINNTTIPCDSVITNVNSESSQIDFKVFPNPVNDELNIRLSSEIDYSIRLFNSNGKLLIQQKFTNSDRAQVLISSLESGVYILLGDINQKHIIPKKIIIE